MGSDDHMPYPQRVLGLDPGLRRTGYAVIDRSGGETRIVEAGVMRVPTRPALADRLATLHADVADLIAQHRPATVAVEDLFSHYDRPKTAILMGHARGVLLLAAGQAGLAVASYLPTQIKRTTTGSGRATKSQMQLAIQMEFGLDRPPEPNDVADALAIALCHSLQHRLAG